MLTGTSTPMNHWSRLKLRCGAIEKQIVLATDTTNLILIRDWKDRHTKYKDR